MLVLIANTCAVALAVPAQNTARKWLASIFIHLLCFDWSVSNSKVALAVATAQVEVLTVNTCANPSVLASVQKQIKLLVSICEAEK